MSSLSCSSASLSSSISSSASCSTNHFYNRKISSNRYQILPFNQICRLKEVLDQKLLLASSITGFPSIKLNLRQFLHQICKNCESVGVNIDDIRLNGGAASYVITPNDSFPYSDLDLIISLDNCNNTDDMQKIRNAVLNSIMKTDAGSSGFMISHHPYRSTIIPESYIHKQVLVNDNGNNDFWSLISLGSNFGDSRIVELKLVYSMRRKYEFSVDSFHIKLDSLLNFLERGCELSEHFYPTVVAESVWGSFQEAKYHLEKKLIITDKPEEIRGGGLLKYCKLLIDGYKPHCDMDVISLERYMCSRFFIDFPDLDKQKHKLLSYLINHFPDDSSIRVQYLQTLEMVVSHSTVCLMNHERYQTLSLIKNLIYDVWNRAQTPLHIDIFDDPQLWALDHIFYGTTLSCMPQSQSFQNGRVTPHHYSNNKIHLHHIDEDAHLLHQGAQLSSPTSLIHTPSDQSPTEPTVCPNFN